jgi:uroporphyrinogen-III synthase
MSTSDRTIVLPIEHKNGNRPGDDQDIAFLSRAANQITSARPLHEALNHVVDFVTKVVTSDSCMIYVLQDDELVLRASKTPHPELVDRMTIKIGQGITGWVAENQQPVVIDEGAYEDSRFKLFNELPEDRFEAFLSVPMVSGGKIIGVINVQNRARHQYSEREIVLTATIGFLVGTEIERVRLDSENSQMLEKLKTRTLVDRAKASLQRSLNLREEDAYRMMQRQSQDRNKTMREIAEAVILIDELKQSVSTSKFRNNRVSSKRDIQN